jgi:hypothetical protein
MFVFAFAFASEKYGVYDLQGNRVSAFEAEPHELPEKARLIRGSNPQKLYVSSFKKSKSSKPSYRYRYKAEARAYIEASRKETFSVCPDKEIEGTWISGHSVALDEKNCLSVQAPNLAGTIRILFLQDGGRTDTIQVLVEQSYIQMGDYTHKVWVFFDPMPPSCTGWNVCRESDYGRYENKKYEQALIVDKTELTIGDVLYYSDFGVNLYNPCLVKRGNKWVVDENPEGYIGLAVENAPYVSAMPWYPPDEDLGTSMRPYLNYGYPMCEIANMRSKLEGFNEACSHNRKTFADTSASGYLFPSRDEWGMLMRAGASTKYYWGDEEDSLTVSRYAWVRPFGYTVHKVAQKQPNAFGLYDMISPNNTNSSYPERICTQSPLHNQMPECRSWADKMPRRVESNQTICIKKSGKEMCEKSFTRNFTTSTRLMRKTPKLHKLEKF